MNGRAIIYPYWENIARGYEDILAVLTLFEMLFLIYALGIALVFFCIWWKHKGWTLKDVRHWLTDKAQRRLERFREDKKNRKKTPEKARGWNRTGIKVAGSDEMAMEEPESGEGNKRKARKIKRGKKSKLKKEE